MGAVTALFYVASTKQNLVKAMVLDSAFISLKQMVLEYVSETTKIPQFLLYILIPLLNKSLKEGIKLSLDDFEMREYINYISWKSEKHIPDALFIASKRDMVVKSSHSEELLKIYPATKKRLIYIHENHAENRSLKTVNQCMDWLTGVNIKEDKEEIYVKDHLPKKSMDGEKELKNHVYMNYSYRKI